VRGRGLAARGEGVRLVLGDLFGDRPLGGFAPGGVSTGHMEGSAHYEGRAVDVFVRPVNPTNRVRGWAVALVRWQVEPGNRQEVENLLRDLHTLKGGARMVEIAPIGDLAHELEFLYEGLSAGVLQPTAALFGLLQSSHDRLAQMLAASARGLPGSSAKGPCRSTLRRFRPTTMR